MMRSGAKRSTRRRPRILVAGLGNLLLQDDGVGVHAVRAIEKLVPRGVRVVEVGTAVLDALHLFEWADKILAFDAMQAGGVPGTVYAFGAGDVEDSGVRTSLHEVGLAAALRFLTSGHTPDITILGVEPERIDYGLELTERVQAAVPAALDAARRIIDSWLAGSPASVQEILAA
jgi:hydrogenase maturation protease